MKKIALIVFLMFGMIAIAQPPKKFFSTYGGNGYDVGYGVKQTFDNGYIITGSTSSFGQGNTDLYLLKLDSMGQRTFETSFGGQSNEIGKGIVQLSDSGYVMVGYTSSFGIGGYDVFLVKTDKTGNLVWKKTIGGSDWDFAHSIQQTSDGGFIIAGTTYSYGYGNADGYVVKTDVNGIVTWSKTFGGKRDDEFKSVVQTADGGYGLTGYTKSYNDSLGDAWVFKIEADGDSVWSKYYGGNKEDFGNEIIESNINDLYIAGATQSFGAGLLDAYAFRTSDQGVLYNTIIDGTAGHDEMYYSLAASKRTSTQLICFAEGEFFTGFKLQVKIAEYDYILNYKNATDYGSFLDEEIYKIVATRDKGYSLVGYTNGYNATLTDVYFAKIDSNLVGGNYSIVSVNEINKNNIDFKLYPNPTTKEIYIKSSITLELDNFKLFDVTGKEIYISDKITSSENDLKIIDVESLDNGIYYIKIMNKIAKISIFH